MTGLPPSPFLSESSMATGGQEAPAAAAKNPVAAGLFPRGFDPERFYADIVEIPAPLFLRDPSPEFRAGEIMPVLKVLAAY